MISSYDEIILTGGEPMLKPNTIVQTIDKIKQQTKKAKIILYTAKTDDYLTLLQILKMINGLTITIHEEKDILPFYIFHHQMIATQYYIPPKSLRLNIFKEVPFFKFVGRSNRSIFKHWQIKDKIVWIKNNCLPTGEVLKRLTK